MQRVEASSARPAPAGRFARRAWLPLAHAAWVLLVLIAMALFVTGLRQRVSGMRQMYWGSVQANAHQNPGGGVTLLRGPARTDGRSVLDILRDPL